MDKQILKYWVGFNMVDGIGRVRFLQLENYFSTLENAWRASATELQRSGLDKSIVDKIVVTRPQVSLDDVMNDLGKKDISVLTYKDDEYPSRLKEIYDYPPVIYVKGSFETQDELAIAIVGTRQATVYGKQVAEELAGDLAKNRITIVSGLARGIDAAAHRSALKAGGRTIAVLACGLDNIYPPENSELADRIASHGALVTEYPPQAKPRAENFPRRNRILSGLSLGVVVVEAGETSGAIITANLALEQNREVFAVPGSILSPTSVGTNRLIQEGAKLVTDGTDILEELNLTSAPHQIEMKEIIPASETEKILIKHLSSEPVHIDDLCCDTGLSIDVVSSTLAMMELKGMIRQVGNMNFTLAREIRERYSTTDAN